MKECIQCGALLEDFDVNCKYCGQSMAANSEPQYELTLEPTSAQPVEHPLEQPPEQQPSVLIPPWDTSASESPLKASPSGSLWAPSTSEPPWAEQSSSTSAENDQPPQYTPPQYSDQQPSQYAPPQYNQQSPQYIPTQYNDPQQQYAQPQYNNQQPQYAPPPYNNQQPQYVPPPYVQPYYDSSQYNDRTKTTAGILGILLGGFGVHKFYLGNIGLGIVYILFSWTTIPALIGLIEGIIYLTMTDEAFREKYCRINPQL